MISNKVISRVLNINEKGWEHLYRFSISLDIDVFKILTAVHVSWRSSSAQHALIELPTVISRMWLLFIS